MEKNEFLKSCDIVEALHFPRWHELPEFDLYMDQVIALAEKYLSVLSPDNKELITPSMINNYVKSGVLPPPKNKKYNRTHLALLMIICSTKSVLEISTISDIVNNVIEKSDVGHVLDSFAEMYENSISVAAKKARNIVAASDSEDVLSVIAIENAVNASAARTVALYAYKGIKELDDEPEKEDKKSEKKSKKSKKQPTAAGEGLSDASAAQENQ